MRLHTVDNAVTRLLLLYGGKFVWLQSGEINVATEFRGCGCYRMARELLLEGDEGVVARGWRGSCC